MTYLEDAILKLKNDPVALWDLVQSYIKDIDVAYVKLENTQGLLRECEWSDTGAYDKAWNACPICGNVEENGHESDCRLAAALKETAAQGDVFGGENRAK